MTNKIERFISFGEIQAFRYRWETQIKEWDHNYKVRWNDGMGAATAPFDLATAIDKWAIDKETNILEIGCSQGYNLDFFKSIGYHKLVGLDAHQPSIDYGQAKFPHLDLMCVDITADSMPPELLNKADLIFSKSTFQCVPFENFEAAVDNACKLLKHDGILIFYEADDEPGKIDREGSIYGHSGVVAGCTTFHHNYRSLESRGFTVIHSDPYLFFCKRENSEKCS